MQRFFTAAFDALKSGGVLAFDISSRHKLENVLGNGFFGEERDDAAYLWQNSLDAQKHIVDMDITFFVQERGGLYTGLPSGRPSARTARTRSPRGLVNAALTR